MGQGMAHNLLKAGFGLTVWNRTASRADALVSEGATQAPAARQTWLRSAISLSSA